MKWLLPFVMLAPWTVMAVPALTADSLRLMAGQAEREESLRASRLDPNDLASLLPKPSSMITKESKKVPVKEKTSPPVSMKYSSQPATKKTRVDKAVSQPVIIKTALQRNVYIPPPRTANAKNQIVSDAVHVAKQRRYGVRMGTWLRARLARNMTSADPGRVELVLMDDIKGDVKALAQGTLLFAEKGYNQGTQRLDMQIVSAITPEGDELALRGLIYDDQRTAGLAGLVAGRPITQSVGDGLSRGLLAASRVALTSLSDSAVVNAVTDRTADAVMRDRQAVLDVKQSQPYTIYVTAQDVLIRVEETF